MEPVETRTVFCWWFWEIFGQSWCRIWINCFFLLWWCWSVWLMDLYTAEVSIFWTFNIHVISKTLVHDTLCITAAKREYNFLNRSLKRKLSINSYCLKFKSPLLLSKQFAYWVNSSAQVFFTVRKKFKAHDVTALPSAIHALGSLSSCRHSINS